MVNFIDNLQEFFALITLPTLVGASIYFGRKLQTLDHLDKTMTVIKNNIKVISNAMTTSNGIDWDGTLLKDYSPLTLTVEGVEYLKKTGFYEIFDKHRASFFKVIDSEEPATKYDVERLAVQSVFLNADAEFMQPVKVYLYNHPKDNFPSLAKVAGIYVRDAYLIDHPEIKE